MVSILVNVNCEGCMNACVATYRKYNGYSWVTDVDVTKLQLDKFPSVFDYIQRTGFSLELSYLNDVMNTAKVIDMQREGGYKEPFRRVVHYSCKGYECLNELENILSIQLNSEKQKNDSFGKRLFKQMVPRKQEA